jgi:O-antigen/teichoic acid export membrane protein
MKNQFNKIRNQLNKQYSTSEQVGSFVFLVASVFANFFNLLYNAYLGRVIGFEEFGLITLFASFLNVSQIPLSAFSKTITHRSAFLYGKYDAPIRSFWKLMRSKMLKPTVIFVILWVFSAPFLAAFFRTGSVIPFLLMTPIWATGLWAAVDSGYLSGNLRLKTLGLMMVTEIVIKFIVSVVLVSLSLPQYIYLAIPISAVISFLIGWTSILMVKSKSISLKPKMTEMHFPKKFYVSTIFTKVTAVAFLSADLMLAKHYLSPEDAGKYALLSLVGKMVYFLGALFNQFVLPFVSRDEGAGRNSKKTFDILMWLTILSVLGGYITVGIFGSLTVPFLLGAKALAIVDYLPFYVFAMGCLAVGSGIVSYYQSKRNYLFAILSFLISVATLIGISFKHNSISDINQVVTIGGFTYLLIIMLFHHFVLLQQIGNGFINGIKQLFLFTETGRSHKNMNILILNWRDTKHKWAGGAESYVQEIAQRWVADGHQVTLFCGNDGKLKSTQKVRGVNVIRKGNFVTVYIWAFLYYMFKFKNTVDVIVDCENGIPFFTPLYSKKPIFLVIHHVHQEVFRQHLKFPLNRFAQFLEGKFMPFVYHNKQVVTVSESTKKEIVKNKIANQKDIHIVHNGVSVSYKNMMAKSSAPLISYVGRLKHYKNIDIALKAFSNLEKQYPTAKFAIVGQGEAIKNLRKLVKVLGLENKVQFFGRTSESS